MARVYFRCDPFSKELVTLALESGVDGIIAPAEHLEKIAGLARCEVLASENMPLASVESKADEEAFVERLRHGERLILARGWEVIPVENMLAQEDDIFAEAESLEKARLAAGILERGVTAIVAPNELAADLKNIVAQCKVAQAHENLLPCRITRVEAAGLGHRVCLDTLSMFQRGQGMLVGNSSAFTFLVHAETEHNEYVAARPFRVNAGGVHSYIVLPHDRTSYLGELKAGDELLAVDAGGDASLATLGRVKTEIRPMLVIEAETRLEDGSTRKGVIFLQNAETIRLARPGGEPVSVVCLRPGDEVLCRLDAAGRHFGMRIKEDIREV